MAFSNLTEVSAFIDRVAARLDPGSRYVGDLRAQVAASRDVKDLEARLQGGSRGQRHAGAEVFQRMSLEDRLLCNLITAETTLFRFAEGELEAIDRELLPRLAGRTARALIVPCSHGEEAFTLAAYLHKVRVPFAVEAFDIQPELVAEAASGRLTFGYPVELLAQAGRVGPEVLTKIHFQVGDAFALPLPPERVFDVVLARNFVGYFAEPEALRLVAGLVARVAERGVLFLDSFCLSKLPSLVEAIEARGGRRVPGRPVFLFG